MPRVRIEIAHAGSSSTMAWPAFRYVVTLPQAYLFVLKDQADKRTFDIPRRPLTAADDEAVREVVARHNISFYTRPMVG
jgi:hypothetical protein